MQYLHGGTVWFIRNIFTDALQIIAVTVQYILDHIECNQHEELVMSDPLL